MFSDYSGIILVIIKKKIKAKSPNSCKLNKMLINNSWVKRKFQREFKKTL